jgi:hypothetical protein
LKNIELIKNIKISTNTAPKGGTFDENTEVYLCADRLCKECGNDHDFNPSFDDVKTTIDLIPELLMPRNERLKYILMVTNKGASV